MLLYQILAHTIHRKTLKSNTKTNLKYLCKHGMIKFNYLIEYFLYQIIMYFDYIIKKHETVINITPIIYVNKIKM